MDMIRDKVLVEKWYEHLNVAMQQYGISDKTSIAMFLAQVLHESGNLTRVVESFNYSIDGLLKTFPRNRISEYQAAMLGRKPNEKTLPIERQKAIANLVYGNRFGNTADEGWLYRGRGLIQLTFKDNYALCSKNLGIDFINHPNLLEQEKYACLSAAWFFSAMGCLGLDDIAYVTKIINGGLNGLSSRNVRYLEILSRIIN